LTAQEWIRRSAVGTVLRHEDYPSDTFCPRRRYKSFCRSGVRFPVALALLLDRDRGEMNDRTASAETVSQGSRIAHVTDSEFHRELSERHCCSRRIPYQRPHLPAVLGQLTTGVDAD